MPKLLISVALLLALQGVFATPSAELEKRQSCPEIHVFGARETTVSPGFGTAGTVVNLVLQAFPGSTSEAINYPACGGQSSCGGVSYANSAVQGTRAVASQVNAFNTRCPNTKLVLVGYSQGGQIMDNAVCGGGDTNIGLSDTAVPIQASAINQIKAVILMGSPRYIPNLSYNVGTCQASGFAPRPAGFVCPSGSKLQNYCDSPDPYCCNGNDQQAHQNYGNKYGQQALTFIKSKLADNGGNPQPTSGTTTTSTPTPTPPSSCTVQKWGQCGGQGYTGCTTCATGSTCNAQNQWYSQCL